jgi:P-type conjugative transfer protein VirB9
MRAVGLTSLLAGVLVLCLASRAFALDQPTGAAQDERIKLVDYDEHNVVAVDVSLTAATQITFAPGEEILDIASGFSAGWEFVNRRNHLYLKARSIKAADGTPILPTPAQWNTNLIVTTNAHVYTFQLNAHAERPTKNGYDPTIAFRVEFRYPAEEARRTQQEAVTKASKQALERKSVPRNWNYSMQVGPASNGIVPSMAYDDGLFTYLRFHQNREFPAVFLVAGDQETIVNTHVDPATPDIIVIHRVADRFVLRLGTAVVAVFNEAFDANGRSLQSPNGLTDTPSTASSIPGVRRTVRQTP